MQRNRQENKRDKAYPRDGKTLFGVATQGLLNVAGLALMSSVFMVYLTDYAGIGPWGATLATTVLFAGRIFDAINDPIQGWIMDSSKVTKHGKYRKFIIASVIVSMISLILLYNIPSGITSNPWLVGVWVVLFYFAFDVGASFFAFVPLVQSLTDDDSLRARFFAFARVVSTIGAMPMGMIMSIALALGESMGGIKNAIGVSVGIAVGVIGAISLLGILMTKEGQHSQVEENQPRVKFKDIVGMVKHNKAMLVHFLGSLFAGFCGAMTTAVASYYIKWCYNADLTTGHVDNQSLAFQTLLVGMAAFLPIFFVTPISPWVVRKLGANVRGVILANVFTLVSSAMIFVLHLIGVLQISFWMLFVLMLVMNVATGLVYVPQYGMWAECIDYNRYTTGKEMGGLVNALRTLMEKGQNAIAGAVIGVILGLIGYNVDSASGAYLGDLAHLPALLNWFAFIMGGVPAILALISIMIYLKGYPITPELKEDMRRSFDEENARMVQTESRVED